MTRQMCVLRKYSVQMGRDFIRRDSEASPRAAVVQRNVLC